MDLNSEPLGQISLPVFLSVSLFVTHSHSRMIHGPSQQRVRGLLHSARKRGYLQEGAILGTVVCSHQSLLGRTCIRGRVQGTGEILLNHEVGNSLGLIVLDEFNLPRILIEFVFTCTT